MNSNKPRTRPAATMEIDAAHLVNMSDPTLPTKATPAALIVCGGLAVIRMRWVSYPN